MLDLLSNIEWNIIIPALTFGLVSSLHCSSMCGPLVCQTSSTPKAHSFYQIGRLISYQILGFLLYFLSKNFFSSISVPLQEYSFYFLIVIYLYVGIRIWTSKNVSTFSNNVFSKLYKKYFKKIIHHKNKNAVPFFMGLISALLPCGLLHTFLLGVIPIHNPVTVFLYIGSFWLATAPVLVGINFSLRKLQAKFNIKSPRLIGTFYFVMGVYLIYVRYQVTLPGANCH